MPFFSPVLLQWVREAGCRTGKCERPFRYLVLRATRSPPRWSRVICLCWCWWCLGSSHIADWWRTRIGGLIYGWYFRKVGMSRMNVCSGAENGLAFECKWLIPGAKCWMISERIVIVKHFVVIYGSHFGIFGMMNSECSCYHILKVRWQGVHYDGI